jgi:hypothetical protein
MRTVHLVTSDDTNDEIIRTMFAGLPPESPFAQSTVLRKSTVAGELDVLQKLKQKGEALPHLVILDGSVRQQSTDSLPIDGGPAADLLQKMAANYASVPIVVLAPTSMEKLQQAVLRRWDVAMWNPVPDATVDGNADDKFARILDNIDNPNKTHERLITITVKSKSASYEIWDGFYKLDMDAAYKTDYTLPSLRNFARRFAPYGSDRRLKEDWKDELLNRGADLYGLILNDIFGPDLLKQIEAAGRGAVFRFSVDLEEKDEAHEGQELFLLPFEAANADRVAENFLCARVPMARRLGIPTSSPNWGLPYGCLGQKVKICLIVGATEGPTELIDQATGATTTVALDKLTLSSEFVEYLRKRSAAANGGRSVEVDLMDEKVARGRAFRDVLEEKLRTTDYDFVHFYGHSITTPDGNTCLIVPGEKKFTGLAVPIGLFASWIKDRTHKSRLPSGIFLSSCQSASVKTAIEMRKAGVDHVIGFRWEVEETTAADFVRAFYQAYLERGDHTAKAFRFACDQARLAAEGKPAWASAIVLECR